MNSFKLIKCYSEEDCKVLEKQGFEFFSYENEVYYLIFNDNINFSNCQVEYEIVDTINF